MSFYPTSNHIGHLVAEKHLAKLCKEKGWRIENCNNYYDTMAQKEICQIIHDFSEDALRIRSQPDKRIFTKTGIKTIDLKSTVREDTGNIAIELSSYYFSWKLYNSLFAYISNGELRFFSPKDNDPHTIILQPKWLNNKFFDKAITELKNKNPYIKIWNIDTEGSGDPFVLLQKNEINPYLDLTQQTKLHLERKG